MRRFKRNVRNSYILFQRKLSRCLLNLPVGKNKYNGSNVEINITSVTVQEETRQVYSKDSGGNNSSSDEYYVPTYQAIC